MANGLCTTEFVVDGSSNFIRNVTTAEAAAKHHICIHGSLH